MEPVCEGSEAKLRCPDGRVIHIVSAMYGRQNDHTCPDDPIKETNCSCHDSLETVTSKCQGEPDCQVQANSSVFGGDPCPDTFKYLDIKYQCIPKQGMLDLYIL